MANDTTAVTTMAPLLLLIVTQLGSVGRDIDLCKAVEEERDPLGLPFMRSIFPPLGRLNFVHGSNLVILNIGLLLVVFLSTGWVKLGTGLLILSIFVIQPVLEIEEYDKILNPDYKANLLPSMYSFHVHVVFVSAILMYIIFYGEAALVDQIGKIASGKTDLSQPKQFMRHSDTFQFFGGLVLLNAMAYLSFTRLLYEELTTVNGRSYIAELSDFTE